jgi:ferredoxin
MRTTRADTGAAPRLRVDFRLCHFCGACVAVCPSNAVFLRNSILLIDENTCTRCTVCIQACPVGALLVEPDSGGNP